MIATIACLAVLLATVSSVVASAVSSAHAEVASADLAATAAHQGALVERIARLATTYDDPSLTDAERVTTARELTRATDALEAADTGVRGDLDGRIAAYSALARTSRAGRRTPSERSAARAELVESGRDLGGDLDAVAEQSLARNQQLAERTRGRVVTGVVVLGGVGTVLLLGVVLPLVASLRRERRRTEHAHAELRRSTQLSDVLFDAVGVDVVLVGPDGRLTLNECARARRGLPADRELRVSDLREGSPARHLDGSLVADEDDALVRGMRGLPSDLQIVVPGRDGEPVHLAIRGRPLPDVDGGPGGAVVVGVDITAVVEGREAVERTTARMAAMADAARSLLHDQDSRAAVCRAVRTVAGGAYSALYEPSGSDLVCTACDGVDVVGVLVPGDRPSLVAEVFRGARARFVADVRDHPGVNKAVVDQIRRLLGRDIRSAAYLPVVRDSRAVGVVIVGFEDATRAEDVMLPLDVLASEAGVAMEREDLVERLQRDSVTDLLTGALNRRGLTQAFEEIGASHLVRDEPVAVVMLDLDRFKAFNDTHGHLGGDALLSETTRRWRGRLRAEHDALGRWGGEEFVVVLPGCDLAAAVSTAEALRGMVSHGQTASAGVTLWAQGESPQAVVDRCDTLLYAAKSAGRDRVAWAALGRAPVV